MGLFGLFKNKDHDKDYPAPSETRYSVSIPEETYICAELELKGKSYIGVFNGAIMAIEPKEVFGWYLSIIVPYDGIKDDMPSKEDTERMQIFCDSLSSGLAINPEHPNAVFMGRITGDAHSQFMWYVNNPELADKYLRNLIESKEYPLEFEYEMSLDKDWKEAHLWLDPLL